MKNLKFGKLKKKIEFLYKVHENIWIKIFFLAFYKYWCSKLLDIIIFKLIYVYKFLISN